MDNFKALSVIIPTLQKDVENLNKLVEVLVSDAVVKEVLIIDNSLKGFNFNSEKVRVIVPKENLFVNPSWNLGLREARCEYICLANDDIKIARNFCSRILEKFTDEYGVIGMSEQEVIDTRDYNNNVVIDINEVELTSSKEVNFKPINSRPLNFGTMMFFKKEHYIKIPKSLKVYFGDDWIIHQLKEKGKINAVCRGQKVYHLRSLSSDSFCNLLNHEKRKYYRSLVPSYKKLLYRFKISHQYVWFVLGAMFFTRKKVRH